MNGNEQQQLDNYRDEDQHWIWRNGMCYSVKKRIYTLDRKLHNLNTKIENFSSSQQQFLKDVQDLNTELTGYFSALADNINIRDLFDFLTICFYEYEHFFKEHKNAILNDEKVKEELLPLARDIVYNHVRNILEFISQNSIDTTAFRRREF